MHPCAPMACQDAEFGGRMCHQSHHLLTGILGAACHAHTPYSHWNNAGLSAYQDLYCCETKHAQCMHEQEGVETSCGACAAFRDDLHCHSLGAADTTGCYSSTSMQMMHGCSPHYCPSHPSSQCMPPMFTAQKLPVHDTTTEAEGNPGCQTESPLEYEYYVWDAAAQEYVQTDQKTGEMMLQDPQYLQYHYRLVENAQDGEAQLLPETVDEFNMDHPVQQFEPERSNHEDVGINNARPDTDLLIMPEALVTPRRQRSPPSIHTHLGETHSCNCTHYDHENENLSALHASNDNGAYDRLMGFEGEADAFDCVDKMQVQRGGRGTPRGKSLVQASDGSNTRFLFSCSRPWENMSLTIRDRELQVRQLKHLQRLQALEKEELLKRQMMMDEMAASLPRAPKNIAGSESNRTSRAQTLLTTNLRQSAKTTRPVALYGVSIRDRRLRNDPVNRGQYFRAKWKSDRFLEQQRHPAFDVKAYDAWLKSRGHLLRARALELQQEEQRLVSMLQQERRNRTKRF